MIGRPNIALASGLLVLACSPARLVQEEGDGSTTQPHEPGESLPDVPPPSLGCEARGGVFAQIGGPWTVLSRSPEYPPPYGLLPSSEDMLAIWRGPFDGSNPMPNFLGARVDYAGALRTMVAPVWDRPVTQEPAVHRAKEGYLVTYCGRFGASDEVTSRIVDARGALLSDDVIRQPDSSCGAARPEGVWTGAVYLFAWAGNSSTSRGLYLDVADATLESVTWSELAPRGNLSCAPRMAVGPMGVALVAGVSNDEIHVFELGLDGRVVRSQPIDLPESHAPGPLAVGAHHDGTFSIFLADRWDPELYVVRLEDGQLSLPRLLEEMTARPSQLLMLHRPGGLLLVAMVQDEGTARVEIIATDHRGTPITIEPLDAIDGDAWYGYPAAAMHGEEAWVLYLAAVDDVFDVRLAQLGCTR